MAKRKGKHYTTSHDKYLKAVQSARMRLPDEQNHEEQTELQPGNGISHVTEYKHNGHWTPVVWPMPVNETQDTPQEITEGETVLFTKDSFQPVLGKLLSDREIQLKQLVRDEVAGTGRTLSDEENREAVSVLTSEDYFDAISRGVKEWGTTLGLNGKERG